MGVPCLVSAQGVERGIESKLTDAEREPDGTWVAGPTVAVELPLFDVGQARRPAAKAALRRLHHRYASVAIEIAANSAYIDELLNYWITSLELEQIRNGLLVDGRAMVPAATDVPMGGGAGEAH